MKSSGKKVIPDLEKILERLAVSRDDQQAWEDLHAKLWPWVLATLYRMLRGNRDLAEDASQEVFIRLHRYCRFDELREAKSIKGYVYVVCENVGNSYLAGLLGAKNLPAETLESLESIEDLEAGRGVLLTVRLQEILKSLKKRDRRLLQMVVEGYQLGEISERLGLSYANAAVRLHRLRKVLRIYMKTKGL